MKLRIHGNSLRVRLSPADVAQLDETGLVMEKTGFGPGIEFIFALRAQPDVSTLKALLDPCGISIEVPRASIHEWSRIDTVGFRHVQSTGGGNTLEILIEKDFECLEGNVERPGVALYPNPNKACLNTQAAT